MTPGPGAALSTSSAPAASATSAAAMPEARPDWITSARHPLLRPKNRRVRDGLSSDAARTKRQREQLAAGVHPATGMRLLAADQPPPTCGACANAVRVEAGNRRVWKCRRHDLGMSHSAASDIRVSWPACTLYEQRERS